MKSTAWHVLKLLNGYLRYLWDCKQGANLELRETPTGGAASSSDVESMEWLEELISEHAAFFAATIRGDNH